MASVKICDRCNNLMSWCTGAGIQIHKHSHAIECYDLCPKCEEELRKFMDDVKKGDRDKL